MNNNTQFTKAVAAAAEGSLETPKVFVENGSEVDYFWYQLCVHQYNLRILATGMSMRGVKLKDLKGYYGLKGRTAKDCLFELEQLMAQYKATRPS